MPLWLCGFLSDCRRQRHGDRVCECVSMCARVHVCVVLYLLKEGEEGWRFLIFSPS